jgi:AIPR protein
MVNADNIAIRQTWIEEHTSKLAKELGESEDDAFLLLAASLFLGISADEIEAEDVVDGSQDKQIDFVHIEDNSDSGEAEILIIQLKNTRGFSSNTLIQLRNGLTWIFEKPRAQLAKLDNQSFRSKISEIREIKTEYGPSNLTVRVYHISNGNAAELAEEYKQEVETLMQEYSNVGFSEFHFEPIGASELFDLLNEGERSRRAINIDLPILYDVNRPSIMDFAQGDTKSLVCTVSGADLAKAAQAQPRDSIFDLNVRPFYGTKGKVNRDILATCATDDAVRFWFLNNGVTMVCDTFDFNRDPDEPSVKIVNAQIVNGCQTTVTLREAYEQGTLDPRVKLLLRVYATKNEGLVEKITLTTNNQNKVTDRDLRANDPVQRDIEKVMLEKYDHFYERKNKQHRTVRGPAKRKIVPSPKAAQAYLAIARKKPSNARGYLGAIWSDFYEEIFKNASVPDLLLSYKLLQYCREQAKVAKKSASLSERELACRVYGVFHIARILGWKLTQDKWGHANLSWVEKAIKSFKPSALAASYAEAVQIIVEMRKADEKAHRVPAMYFKNTASQRKLNTVLATGR